MMTTPVRGQAHVCSGMIYDVAACEVAVSQNSALLNAVPYQRALHGGGSRFFFQVGESQCP
jgi:hypothetical protein